jgi:gliding motility-associated-like protein
MKRVFLVILLLTTVSLSVVSQITPNGNSGASTTNYTSGTANDPIYIWCADGLTNNTASLTANSPSGTGPFTFNWFYHDQTTFSWEPYQSTTGTSSTLSNLPSDGYQVQIFDASNTLVGCYVAWVWNMNSDVTASNTSSACDATALNGSVNVNGSFTYYNPPPVQSLITASTNINVCFSANHTYVSDLAFYLVGPASCGSPVVLLSPNPGAIGQGSICNSGNNVSNLCFSNTSSGNLNVCTASVPLSGSYGSYGPSNTPINWSSLYGCNASEGGWRVQIYDCIGADIGSLTNANITFSNLSSFCGSPTTITYNSGTINSAINDNSCSAGTASVFQVPASVDYTTPFTVNAAVTYLWTSTPSITIPGASSSLSPALTSLPFDSYDFNLTATITYAGGNVSYCSGFTPTIGTPAEAGLTYSWSPASGLSNAAVAQPLVNTVNTGSTPLTVTYTLTATNTADGGCTATDQITVTINPVPDLNFSGDQQICSGSCTNITVSGADFYEWAPASGIVDSSLVTQNLCPSNTTSYAVTGYNISLNSVTNGDFSGGANGFSSSYLLSSDTQPEGTYFVTTNANLTHPGFTGVDHTTGTGNFMVVNGSGTPGTSVWCQTITVEPNTDYIFSTWVSSLAVGFPAQLQFSINGVQLGSPFNAPISTGQWDEFYTTWNSGTETSATICIVNQNTSLGGNDFGIDDITFASLCSSTETVTITVNPLPNINGGPDVILCEGASTTLSGQNGLTYSWSNGVVNGQSFVPTSSGNYEVTGTDANGCVNTDNVLVTLLPPPTSDFSADSLTGYPILQVNFTNTSQDADNYLWVFGNGETLPVADESGQSASYENPGTYTVYLIADNNYCTDTSALTVLVIPYPDPVINIPNVFTPNGDGANDVFFISATNVSSVRVTIVNRWGNLMNSYEDINGKWDGTVSGNEASEGVYFFTYTIKGINGKEMTGHGNITLKR